MRTPAFAFVMPAALIFLFALFVKTAPWGWDNTKLMIWSYFICLPFLVERADREMALADPGGGLFSSFLFRVR